MSRIMGLDVGAGTIGVAISDELGLTAQGVKTIPRSDEDSGLASLFLLMDEYGASRIVIGWPKNMNGTEGEQCVFIREFADELKHSRPEAEIVLWDERLTTVAANRSLTFAGIKRRRRKKVVDKVAAVLILQGYLDSLSLAGRGETRQDSDMI